MARQRSRCCPSSAANARRKPSRSSTGSGRAAARTAFNSSAAYEAPCALAPRARMLVLQLSIALPLRARGGFSLSGRGPGRTHALKLAVPDSGAGAALSIPSRAHAESLPICNALAGRLCRRARMQPWFRSSLAPHELASQRSCRPCSAVADGPLLVGGEHYPSHPCWMA
jgi:hypothetical protein